MTDAEMTGDLQTEIAKDYINMMKEMTDPPFDKVLTYRNTEAPYTSLGGLIRHLRPILTKHNFAFFHTLHLRELDGALFNIVRCTLVHKSGATMISEYNAGDERVTDQQRGSAITYGKRYTLAAVTSVAGEDDDDGNIASDGIGVPPEKASPPKSSPRKSSAKKLAPDTSDEPPVDDYNGEYTQEQLDNMSMDELIERTLFDEVYARLVMASNAATTVADLHKVWKTHQQALKFLKEHSEELYSSIHVHVNTLKERL